MPASLAPSALAATATAAAMPMARSEAAACAARSSMSVRRTRIPIAAPVAAPQLPAFDRKVAGGLCPLMLQAAKERKQRWDGTCASFFGSIRACGWCGRVAYGGQHCTLNRHMKALAGPCTPDGTLDLPPAYYANPAIGEFMDADEAKGTYWACQACYGSTKRRTAQEALQVGT